MIVRGLRVRNAARDRSANRNETQSEEVEVRKKNPVWSHGRRTEMFFNGLGANEALHAGRRGG